MAVKESSNFLDKNGLKEYLAGQSTPDERGKWEEVLLEDEEAFSLYMEALDEMQDELPELMNQGAFVNRVMTAAGIDNIPRIHKPSRTRWYERTLFHYVIAASLTLLFMSSGVFDRLMTGNMDVVVPEDAKGLSYSEQMMQATSGWLDQFMSDGNK